MKQILGGASGSFLAVAFIDLTIRDWNENNINQFYTLRIGCIYWPDYKGLKHNLSFSCCIYFAGCIYWPDYKGLKHDIDKLIIENGECCIYWPDYKGLKQELEMAGAFSIVLLHLLTWL